MDRLALEQRPIGRRETTIWPRYDAAALGFRNYWYPVMSSRKLGSRPISVTLLGDPIMLIREQGRPYALFDQCPHRGIPLSVGRREFPGTCTWTCRYHGWTYDLETGVLRAALTDGPDSPICGKVRVKTYPVQERAGLIWVFMGEGEPPPVETDIPGDFLHEDSIVGGRITLQKGNWRYAAEASFDSGHAFYLHRYGTVHFAFRKVPPYSRPDIAMDQDGWLVKTRSPEKIVYEAEYPGFGRWPRHRFWHRVTGGQRTSIRLPGIVRLQSNSRHTDYVWVVPVDQDHHRLCQFSVLRARGLEALRFRLYYRLVLYWVHHVQFNNQDVWMVSLMPETPPERLYRPDAAITAWRKLCEHARGEFPAAAPLEEQLKEMQAIG